MWKTTSPNETREDVLHVPNLFDFFCSRTADDMRSHGSDIEPPTTSFAGIVVTILATFAFYVFGRPQLAKATFVLFGVFLLWTAWGVIIRSSEQILQKADTISAGVFPPAAAPFVLSRLKWWNHLITPVRWGKHSRLFDRQSKLERRIEDLENKVTEAVGRAGSPPPPYLPPDETEIIQLAEQINSFSERKDHEMEIVAIQDEVPRLRAELLLHRALLYKLDEMADKLNRIDKLSVVFQAVSPEDLSQVVSEAIQLLDERRLLVLNLDTVDPEDFIDLVTIRMT
ncbi:MAG: hypothetical protein FWG74_09220 [Planctomycetes bacterium]|nr:hypothetical protein [Planctomycetota bacterium]